MTSRMIVEVYTSPQELRQLADELERKWVATQLGDSVPRVLMHVAPIEVVLIADQDKMKPLTSGDVARKGKRQ